MHKSGKPFSQLSWSKTTMKRWFLILAFCTLSSSRSVKRSHHSSKHSHRSRDGGGSRETFHDFMKQHPYLAANVHSVHQDFLGMIIFSLFNSRPLLIGLFIRLRRMEYWSESGLYHLHLCHIGVVHGLDYLRVWY